MRRLNLTSSREDAFLPEVARLSGQDVSRCYQCGNCTAGCPMQDYYDVSVHRVMRQVQAGLARQALSSRTLWLCAGCGQCSERCPNKLDVAGILETLRQMARAKGYQPEPRVAKFAEAFLDSVNRHGRIFEIGLLIRYKLQSGRLLDDIDLGPKLALAGKLGLKPHSIKGQAEVAAIFERYAKEAANERA